jgi:NADPH:quinone reductase
MKAIQFEQHGKPEVLELVELPKPEPAPKQVLIRVTAVGINYADIMHRVGAYPQSAPLPMIPGTDVAGTIEQLGADVAFLTVGTRIVASLFPGAQGGGYAEYVAVDVDQVVPVPDTVGFEVALAMLGQGWTAYLLLTEAAKLQPHESVLIHAATGGVGSLAVQLAKLLGSGQVIGLVGSPQKQILAKELGCDHVFLSSEPQWTQQVREVTKEQGVNVILDSVGGAVIAENLNVLAPFGRLIAYGALSQQIATLAAEQAVQLLFNNQSFVGFSLPNFVGRVGYAKELTQRLLSYVSQGNLRVIVRDIFPLEQAAKAHQAIEERKTTGKVILKVE